MEHLCFYGTWGQHPNTPASNRAGRGSRLGRSGGELYLLVDIITAIRTGPNTAAGIYLIVVTGLGVDLVISALTGR